MKISKKSEYALKALMELSHLGVDSQLNLRQLSLQAGIPYKFLEQIMGALRSANIVLSYRGKVGGYRLARDPRDISLREVLERLEGPIVGSDYHNKLHDSPYSGLYQTLSELERSLRRDLQETSLWDLCQRTQELHEAMLHQPMYYI